MGEHSKIAGEGYSCAYCCETGLEKPVRGKVYNFEEWYPDESTLVIQDNGVPETQQLLKYLKENGPGAEEGLICPSCNYVETDQEYGELYVGLLWECTDCSERHCDEEEAENCCEYNRRYAAEQEMRQRSELERAQMLLEQSGFVVRPAQVQPSQSPLINGGL